MKNDVFKRCSEMFGQRRGCPAPMSNCLKKKYKFYLSFENALCEDYITERRIGMYLVRMQLHMRHVFVY